MCIDPNERLIASVQGWEDDDGEGGPRGDIDGDDDILSATTHVVGTGTDLKYDVGQGTYTVRSFNANHQAIEATFAVDSTPTDTDGDGLTPCQEIASSTDPGDADSDDDGLADGEEIMTGTNPLDSDTDDDRLSDELTFAWPISNKYVHLRETMSARDGGTILGCFSPLRKFSVRQGSVRPGWVVNCLLANYQIVTL